MRRPSKEPHHIYAPVPVIENTTAIFALLMWLARLRRMEIYKRVFDNET
jgi:hypothetical protein